MERASVEEGCLSRDLTDTVRPTSRVSVAPTTWTDRLPRTTRSPEKAQLPGSKTIAPALYSRP